MSRRLVPFLLPLAFACAAPDANVSLEITDAGFATPESVLHDPVADVYLVSNINGAPLAKDDNGFISRLLPDGTVDALTWIDGATDAVTLHAPKGMAIIGDTLFVADIDVVRLFDRATGAPLGERAVPGASLLNDLVASPTGTLYVTDSGVDSTFTSIGTDALWQFVDGTPSVVVQDPSLGIPNGVAVTPSGIVVVSFGSGGIYRIQPGSPDLEELPAPEQGGFDGVVTFADGSMLVSSWQAQAIFRIAADGSITRAVDSIPSPADIGWDATRDRVLIPVFQEDRVVIRHLD